MEVSYSNTHGTLIMARAAQHKFIYECIPWIYSEDYYGPPHDLPSDIAWLTGKLLQLAPGSDTDVEWEHAVSHAQAIAAWLARKRKPRAIAYKLYGVGSPNCRFKSIKVSAGP